MKTKYIVLGALVILFLAVVALFSMTSNNSTSENNIQWNTDLNNALNTAQSTNKLVLVDVYAPWCGYCKEMDQKTYTDPTVQQKLVNYVLVKVDGDQNPELMKKYQIYSYPTVLILDSSGNVVKTISGYQSPDDFINQI